MQKRTLRVRSVPLGVLCLFACGNTVVHALGKDSADQILAKPIVVAAPITKRDEKQKVIENATKVEVHEGPSQSSEQSVDNVARPTIALALGGGGARGAAHVGVIRALNEAGIHIDKIVGNSMGAIIGGLYAAGVPLDQIETILLNKSLFKAYVTEPFALRFIEMPFIKIGDRIHHRYAGFYTGNQFQKFLEGVIPPDAQEFQNLKVPFSAVATNLIDGKAYSISSGHLAAVIRASSSISPLLKPLSIDDKLYVDGGIRANLPAYAARESGADIVIAVLVDEPLQTVPAKRFKQMKSIASRMGDIVLSVNDDHQLQFADIIVNPDVSKIPVLSSNPAYARRAILAGKLAGQKAIPAIQKLIREKEDRATKAALSR